MTKYKEGDVVYKAEDAIIDAIPMVEVYHVGHRIEIDYQHGINGDYYDFTYYSRSGKCIGNEEEIFPSVQEVIDDKLLKYKNCLEYYQNAPNYTEKTRKEAIECINRCIEKWRLLLI